MRSAACRLTVYGMNGHQRWLTSMASSLSQLRIFGTYWSRPTNIVDLFGLRYRSTQQKPFWRGKRSGQRTSHLYQTVKLESQPNISSNTAGKSSAKPLSTITLSLYSVKRL